MPSWCPPWRSGSWRRRRDGARTIAAGNLTPVRELTDVRDVARALALLLEPW